MPASRTQQLTTAERRRQCLALRLAGTSWDRIAERLGYASKGAACKDFTRALDAARTSLRTTSGDLLEVEVMRADRLQAGHWPRAIGGDPKSAMVVLNCIDRRVKWLRLDAEHAAADNAVDAWLGHVAGGGLSDDDAAALAAAMAPAAAA